MVLWLTNLEKYYLKKEDIKNEIIQLIEMKDFKIDDYIKKKILDLRVYHSNDLSSKNIINTWKKISNNLISERNNWIVIRLYLQIFILFKLFKELLAVIKNPFKQKTENYYYRKKNLRI